MTSRQPDALSFSAAMEQLEAVLRRIEGEEIDVDELAEELKTAAVRGTICGWLEDHRRS